MRVLIADKFDADGVEGLRAGGHEVEVQPDLGPETLGAAIEAIRPDVLVVRSTKVPASVIEGAGGLRGIIRAGAGYDNIDCVAAGEAGIPVANCPGMNAIAVAELAMGLLICCDRRIPDQCAELKGGHWNKKEFSKARGLKGRTLGVLGVGAIGSALIRRASAFEMPVLAWSLKADGPIATGLGARYMGDSREDLLAMAGQCDAISVHVGLNEHTKGMCDGEFFDAMKDGAIFLNTSRGGVVDQDALGRAIGSKGIRAGLDVYQDQPSQKDVGWSTPVTELPGVFTTHHCGASTDQAQLAVAEETVRLINALESGGRLENCVNEALLAGAAS